ncbi:hypothetical protein I6F21_14210 [Bradyrhizobium sp. NBAIM03]|uniref:hypothetical protein n=1 Tax=Bradyrhizobium sp. NBAIM03 TaxID=2793816 RepID=UPI001CD63625|nr:hypothetical protein [Bradyrhizobium sp. NBAIM03]MCA1533716.1 hypothetical protein [Bradyrhizobium sp. NBAIM03]
MSTALAPARQGIPFRADPSAKARAWVESFIRAATVRVLSRLQKTSAESILRDTGWHHDSLTGLILRAPVEPLKQADLPGDSVSRLLLLSPRSTAAQLRPLATVVDLKGVSSLNLFPLPENFAAAGFVGEGQSIPFRQGAFVGLPVGPVRKLALLSGLSAELETASGGLAQTIISATLENAVGRGLDAVLLSADAATDDAPAGLLYGVTPITAGASMSEDLGALVGAIAAAGIDTTSVVFVCAPPQAISLSLLAGPHFGHKIIEASGLAAGVVVAVAAAGLIFAGDGADPVIDISKQALLHVADPASQIGTVAVAPDPNVIAAPTVSMLQADLLALRCISQLSWSIAPGAVQLVNGVVW